MYIDIKRLERYLKHTLFAVERAGDGFFVQHPFFILPMPTATVPEWFRPAQDGSFRCFDEVGDPYKGSVLENWQALLARPVISRLQLTDRFDLVEGSKYCILLDEVFEIRWLSHELLSLIIGSATMRYEFLSQHAIRLLAGDNVVAVFAERIDPEIEKMQAAQRMAEEHARLAESYRRMEEAARQEPPPCEKS